MIRIGRMEAMIDALSKAMAQDFADCREDFKGMTEKIDLLMDERAARRAVLAGLAVGFSAIGGIVAAFAQSIWDAVFRH
ncbi:MAG: hypothetical protein GC191_08230 [Azospirillum sp.]|nr:hypothetical protein [Azospirillum sp.]